MPIAFRSGLGSTNGGGVANITMTMPAGVVNEDVLVMMITTRGGTASTITTPAGWTLLDTALNSTTVLKQAYFWKVASSEPASFVVTVTSGKTTGVIIALSGASLIAPVAAQRSGQVNASSGTVSAATLGTFPAINGIDLFLGGTAIGTTAAAPTNYALAGQETNTGGNANTRTTSGISYRILSNVTTVGALTANYTSAAVNIGHHLFIYERLLASVTTSSITLGTIKGTAYMTGALTTSSAVSGDLRTPANLKYWDGTAWVSGGELKAWNGSAWVGILKRWNGTSWA